MIFPVCLISLHSNGETPLYLNPQKYVNTILRKIGLAPTRRGPTYEIRARSRLWVKCVTSHEPAKKAPISGDRATPRRGTSEIFAVAKIFMVSARESDETSAKALSAG